MLLFLTPRSQVPEVRLLYHIHTYECCSRRLSEEDKSRRDARGGDITSSRVWERRCALRRPDRRNAEGSVGVEVDAAIDGHDVDV